MRYYPIHLDIRGRHCLVVGGGSVGTRKVQTLLECGARVTVVSPQISSDLRRLEQAGEIRIRRRSYRSPDMRGVFLVIGATDDQDLNQRVSRDAARAGIPCNIADRPAACSFVLPAVVQRGDLVITISTSGKSPALAKKLRRELQRQYGPEYAVFLDLMGAIRERLLDGDGRPADCRPIFERLVHSDLIELIRTGDVEKIDARLKNILGEGYCWQELLSAGTGKQPPPMGE